MSQSPFIKIWLRTPKGDIDLSDAIQSIRHESDRAKGLLVEFKVKSDRALDIANHNDMVAGGVIVYQYGFMKSLNQSPMRTCRIGNIDYAFDGGRVGLTIKATDRSLELKKGKSFKIWQNVTLSDIAQQIAGNYGLDFIGKTTTKKYVAIPQAGRSDWDLLNYIMSLEHENYHVSSSDGVLYLEKNLRSKNSARSFKLGENVVSVRVNLKEISQKSPSSSSPSIDDRTGKATTAPVTESSSEQTDGKFSLANISKTAAKGANKILDFDINKKKIGEHFDLFGAGSPSEKTNMANKVNTGNAEKTLTCDLQIELDCVRKAGEVITLQLPVEKLSGNWLIETSVDIVSSSGAFTDLSLTKVGTSRPVKTGKDLNDAKVNNTEGAKDTKATTRIYFDKKGKFEKRIQ